MKNIFTKHKIITIILLITIAILLLPAVNTLNAGSLMDPERFSANCAKNGSCEVSDFVMILIIAAEIILGLTGSLALLAFIIGGAVFIVSAGNTQQVERGRQIIIGSVIGIIIVMTSWMIINFTLKTLNYQWAGSWYNFESSDVWRPINR